MGQNVMPSGPLVNMATWVDDANSVKNVSGLRINSKSGVFDLKSQTLRLSGLNVAPFFYYNEVAGTPMLTHGVDVEVLKILMKVHNFRYQLLPPVNNEFGFQLPNGSVSGIIGMVARNDIEFAMGNLALTGDRENVTDFSYPHYTEDGCIWTRAPALANRTWQVFIPFSNVVWVLLAIFTISFGIILWSALYFFPSIGEGRIPPDPVRCILYALLAMCAHGTYLEFKSGHLRFILFFVLLFGFMLSAIYSGTLTSVFTVPIYEKPINSLDDFLRSNITLAVRRGNSLQYAIQSATEGKYKLLRDKLDPKGSSPLTLSEISPEILQGKTAFIVVSRAQGKMEACQINQGLFYDSEEGIFSHSIAAVVGRGSFLRSAFSVITLKLKETGLISKWLRDEMNEVKAMSRQRDFSSNQSNHTLSITDLQGAFYITMIGFAAAILTFIIEFVKLI